MDEKTNDYEIPYLEPKLFYGLSTKIKENAIFVNDVELLHPAGKILVIDNLNNGKQNFIKLALSKKEVTGIIISPNRNFVVVAENGVKPTLSIYEIATQKRMKLLGIPFKESTATDWAGVAFMEDNIHLIAVTGHPDWNYLIYDWLKGCVVSYGQAAYNSSTVTQIAPNPEDSSMFLLIGPGHFRLMSQSDRIWRQYGFSRADNVPLQVACWLGPQTVLAGSKDGRLLLVAYGELRGVYEANMLSQIQLTDSEEVVTLASNAVTDDNKSGIHEVRALISFEKGFLYSCNLGEVYVFEKVSESRWVKKNVIKISSVGMGNAEQDNMYRINYVTVNPSQNKIVCTTMKTELYISDIFFDQDFDKEPVAEFNSLGNGYHDGPIASISTCLWKPYFLTAGLYDKTIRLWNYELMKVVIQKKFTDVIYSASMHPSGFYCLLGFTDKLRFNLILANDLKTVGQVDIRACKNVAFATGGHLFAATRDIVIEVYSAVFFTRLHILSGHLGPIKRLVFGPRDKSLWSCGGEGSLYEWDMDSGKRISDIFTNKNGQFGLAVGDAVYSVGTDGVLKEVMNGSISREIDMLQTSLSCVTLGNSGQLLFLGGQKGTVVSVLYPLVHPPKWQEFSMHSQPLQEVVINHNDRILMTASEEGFLCLWHIMCSKEKRSTITETMPSLSEILISLHELEELYGRNKELSDRLSEIEGQHEYTTRQITANNEAQLRETQSNYNAIVEDLKFRLKQMEREHLVEINKYQTKLKEESNSLQKKIEEQEQHFSNKLLDTLKKIENLKEINNNLQTEFERKKEEIEQLGFRELKETINSKNEVITQKEEQIEQLHGQLRKILCEKDKMKLTMEKSFFNEKEEMASSFKSQMEEKENSVKEINTENGIMGKQIFLMKTEIEKLILTQKRLVEDDDLKLKKINIYAEEIEMLKKELDEKECVISEKDKLIVYLTKQNDAFNKDIKFRDTTVDALIQKIEPKEKEIKHKEQLLEKV
ncbi:cilia- and flagella-associated protein 57 [Halyomorpha halys]|uniref:cilia- and flagella-associated protein 57 n=1 Tax=Halyomorpha halys TaxID=286706 RepID=UPI0034D333FE